MTSIFDQLDYLANIYALMYDDLDTIDAAKNRIKILEAEVERLREALEKIVALEDDFESSAAMTAHEWQMFHTARAALANKGND
jgi:hypothetical protein